MAILKEIAVLIVGLGLRPGFSVCELGDQWMAGKVPQLAEDWYRELGCGRYVSIDGNGKGTFTADLNLPIPMSVIPPPLLFDLVTDFGTGEHIFDQAQVWRTLHDLCKPGGYLIVDRPSQGYKGHCYYRIDRCVYEDIAAANGYEVLRLKGTATPRGELHRVVFRLPPARRAFVVPQQGRYRESLVIG